MSSFNLFRIPVICLLAAGILTSSACGNAPKPGPDEVVVNGVTVPKLLPRKEGLGSEGEIKEIRSTYDGAIATLQEDTTSAETYLKLASAFIAEGRISGNGGYYSNAAIRMLDKALAADFRL